MLAKRSFAVRLTKIGVSLDESWFQTRCRPHKLVKSISLPANDPKTNRQNMSFSKNLCVFFK